MSRESAWPSSSFSTKSGVATRYLVLSGAKINAGDFLIRKRCLDLLGAAKPEARIRVHDRWRPLDHDSIRWADAILLCGGPALQPHLYPDIYPLTSPLEEIEIPIIGVGLGWKGIPGDHWSERTYYFTQSSQRLLRRIALDGWPISCRDPATERVLKRWGVEDATMTGDPAWFDLECIGSPFEAPPSPDALLFSMPASPVFFSQSLEVLRRLKKRGGFRRIVAGFNHGWSVGKHVGAPRAAGFQALRDRVADLGVEALDLSGSFKSMLYAASEFDLHIGYRLHSHLQFLSRRKPSILLEEDGRGSAAGEALGLPGIAAWRRRAGVEQVLPAFGLAGNLLRPIQRRLQGLIHADDQVASRTLSILCRHRADGFVAFTSVAERIDEVYRDRMRPFLRSLP